MERNTKLELTWVGKYDEQQGIEPRILIENPKYSFGTIEESVLPNGKKWKGNMLIHGDNMLALRALESEYSNSIKCVYIDPPYNTGSAFEYYDDSVEHSIWLNLMKPRLESLYRLLADDGLLFVQIDDNEQAYLTVLLDEIFGRNNHVNTVCVKMSEASGVKMAHIDRRLPKLKEYILIYCKKVVPTITAEKVPIDEWNEEYKNLLVGIPEDEIDELHCLIKTQNASQSIIDKCNAILNKGKIISLSNYFRDNHIAESEQDAWKFAHAKYIVQAVGSSSVFNLAKSVALLPQDIMAVRSASGLVYLIKTAVDLSSKQPRVQVVFADENLTRNQGDLWLDIKTTGGVGQEGNVLFANSKKPEKLIKKILSMCTKEGDLVLDSFLGSGTTAAVAHKMNRRYIGIELGEHAYSLCYPRLKAIVNGTDSTGISRVVNWTAGGGFKFYELAPSLLKKDAHGHLVINKEYNADMLAAAMAKMEGFTYEPSTEIFWKQGHSSETDFIYTTTQFVTVESLGAILDTMADGESLLVCCKAFQPECKNFSSRISVKKIPSVLLGRCEFDHDDYSLNIIELPQTEEIDDSEDLDNSPETFSDDTSSEPSLF